MISNPILIVDDEVEMRIAMSETLKHCGYPVELSHRSLSYIHQCHGRFESLRVESVLVMKVLEPRAILTDLFSFIKIFSNYFSVVMITGGFLELSLTVCIVNFTIRVLMTVELDNSGISAVVPKSETGTVRLREFEDNLKK